MRKNVIHIFLFIVHARPDRDFDTLFRYMWPTSVGLLIVQWDPLYQKGPYVAVADNTSYRQMNGVQSLCPPLVSYFN